MSSTHGAVRRSFLLVVLALIGSVFGAADAGAAPTLRAATSSASGSAGTTVTAPTPAGVLAGDVLLAALTVRLSPSGKITAPSGWQLLRREVATGGASLQQAVYVRVAGSFEPAASSWRLSSAVGWSATVLAFSGADAGAPVAATSGRVTSSSAQIVAPSLSAPVPDMKLVGFFGNNGRMPTTPPPGMLELTDLAAAGSSTATLESAAADLQAAGSTGTRTAVAGAANSRSVGQLVALRPAAGVATPSEPAPDYALGVAPGSLSAAQGSSASATVSTSATGGFGGTISLAVDGLPAGASASFSPATATAGQSSQLTLSVSSSTVPGSYPLVVTGSDGSRTRSASLSLTVTQPSSATPVGWALPAALPLSTGAASYVATDGSDANSGTLASPWRTVQKALATLQPGQIAYVRGGVYPQNLTLARAGTATSPITIRNYPGEQPILRPGTGQTNNMPLQLGNGAAYARFEGLVVEGATGPSTTNVYAWGNAHDIEFRGVTLRGSQRQGFFSEASTSRIHIVNSSIRDNGGFGPTQLDHNIYIQGTSHLIAGSLIANSPNGWGIQIYPSSSGIIVANNTIVGALRDGIIVGSDGSKTTSGLKIVNNVIANNGRAAIGTYWGGSVGSSNVATSNLAWGNGGGNFTGTGIAYEGNTVADPLFAAGFRLQPASPALGAARPDYATQWDLDGVSRPQGGGPDLGAFER